MSEVKSKELAVATTGFTALANNNLLEEAMTDEYAGLEFSIDRVKLPAGGGTAFEVPATARVSCAKTSGCSTSSARESCSR